MKQVTDLQIEKAQLLKAYRSATRLKYSLMADAALMRELPAFEMQIDAAMAAGEPLELNVGRVFDQVD